MAEPLVVDWGSLRAGHLLLDATGTAWRIGGRHQAAYGEPVALWVDNGLGTAQWVSKGGGDQVVVIDENRDDAVLMVMAVLEGVLELPEPPTNVGALGPNMVLALQYGHLMCHHNLAPPKGLSLRELIGAHATAHVSPDPGWTPHVHVHDGRK